MKKTFTILLGVLFVVLSAQTTPPTGASTTENYIFSRTYLEAVTASTTSSKQVQGIQYFDGLGRPKQNVSIKSTPLGNDLITPIEYDGFGRQVKDFLPLPQSATNNGGISTSPETSYYTTNFPGATLYSEKKLEASPLDRLEEQGHPGTDWGVGSTHSQKFTYQTNIDGEVKKYVASFDYNTFNLSLTIAPSSDVNAINGYYKANQLYKNTVTDEDGNVSIEFKNGQGQTILVRKNDGTNNIDTYYVYNDYDQLAYVIPPLAASKFNDSSYVAGTILSTTNITDLNELCYQYKYDGRNRLVEKKLPGKGWEYMVYDNQDRLVATQDAVLGSANNNFKAIGWLFTKYDQFGRVAYTGFTADSSDRNTLQSSLESNTSNPTNNENRTTPVTFTQNNLDVYYTNTAFPTTITVLLSVNYYDTYPAEIPNVTYQLISSSDILTDNSTEDRNTKGLPTASMVKNIEDNNWTKNYTWYDRKGRMIATYSQNHLGGYNRMEIQLDFSGVPLKNYRFHKRISTDAEIIIKESFEYDNQNRLVKHWHNVNNASNDELLVENHYNELGQLDSKKVGGIAGSPLETVDYRYNIRGWMSQINGNADGTLQTNKLFNYSIFYNTLNSEFSGGTAKYNGNIAQITWKTNYTVSDVKLRNYSYEYDSLNRLLNAKYYAKGTTDDTDYYNENLTYDFNGNIKTLKRNTNPDSGTTANKIDDLIYNYENGNYSNRLSQITLPANELNNSSGYDALQNTISYDLNGNMSNQLDKKISDISYNFLNLPNQIVHSNGIINYVYRADGLKLKKVYAGKETDYLEGFQYETLNGNTTLQFFPTAEGYYDFTKNLYIYNYVDHLGNVRLSYTKNSAGVLEILEESNYYPFGLKHEGYNEIAGATPSYQYKYNGKELQETGMYDYGARFYMPDIGRWGVVDPLAETSRRWSTYTYAYDNPLRFIDPDGRSNQDIIKVNSQGYVQEIIPQKGPHVVQDMNGNELSTNDQSFDQEQLDALVSYAGRMSDFELQDAEVRLFTPFSAQNMADSFNSRGIGDMKSTANYLQFLGESTFFMTPYLSYVASFGQSEFDFAGQMSFLVQQTENNYAPIQGGGDRPDDGVGGFVKFEGSNTLYNVYDAGNFMTGKAYQLLGVPLETLKKGANINSKASFEGSDTPADQRALTNGYNYNRVGWKR